MHTRYTPPPEIHKHSRRNDHLCVCVRVSTSGFDCAYLYVVDGKRQQVAQQVGARAVVYAAVKTAIKVDVVTAPLDTCADNRYVVLGQRSLITVDVISGGKAKIWLDRADVIVRKYDSTSPCRSCKAEEDMKREGEA
ncbi:hypothetical protein EYF80_022609 [Liparis tanakae]|uniref:Uncharacterized protein n=1 Tax=Liparis tanakae TaxID=230148 RepID=A0A4Z2HQY5_9TELE|nr:hypothetical protein EYF80_022609 [Liparis tanakae]